jgi:hypothetical protein
VKLRLAEPPTVTITNIKEKLHKKSSRDGRGALIAIHSIGSFKFMLSFFLGNFILLLLGLRGVERGSWRQLEFCCSSR